MPKDVKGAIDDYLKSDVARRHTLRSDGVEAYLFQPLINYRTLVFDNHSFDPNAKDRPLCTYPFKECLATNLVQDRGSVASYAVLEIKFWPCPQ